MNGFFGISGFSLFVQVLPAIFVLFLFVYAVVAWRKHTDKKKPNFHIQRAGVKSFGKSDSGEKLSFFAAYKNDRMITADNISLRVIFIESGSDTAAHVIDSPKNQFLESDSPEWKFELSSLPTEEKPLYVLYLMQYTASDSADEIFRQSFYFKWSGIINDRSADVQANLKDEEKKFLEDKAKELTQEFFTKR